MRQVAILKVKVGFLGEISVSVWRALSNDFICHSMHRVYYVHEAVMGINYFKSSLTTTTFSTTLQ